MNALFLVIFLILLSSHEGNSKMDRIAGGKKTKKGQFPFFAQMFLNVEVNETINLTFECGASLIHPEWLLSAGHCFQLEPFKIIEMNVLMGTNLILDPDADLNHIQNFIVHENYTEVHDTLPNGTVVKVGSRNDIALAQLQRPYAMYKYVRIAYLPPPKIGGGSTRCKIGTIVGIGDTKPDKPSPKSTIDTHVLYAVLKSKTKNELLAKFPYNNPNKFYSETKWLHGHPLEGDSGGPFLCYMDKKPVIYGIMSAAMLEPSEYNTQITEYEEVDKHVAFILNKIPTAKINIIGDHVRHQGIVAAKSSETAAMSIYYFAIALFLLMHLK